MNLRSVIVFSLLLLVFSGCDIAVPAKPKNEPVQLPPARVEVNKPPLNNRVENTPTPRRQLDQSVEAKAVRKVAAAIDSVAELGPTVVVWLLDGTESNASTLSAATAEIERWYEDRQATAETEPLQTMIGLYADELQWLTEKPVTNFADIAGAFAKIRVQTGVRENTFAAATEAFERFSPERLNQGKEVVFVIISDEAGDDDSLVDELAPRTMKLNTPFYVVGSPAPFGEESVVLRPLEQHEDGSPAVRHGPETRFRMSVSIPLAGSHWGGDRIDAGFGPYGLEYLARASGGAFVALRPGDGEGFRGFEQVWPDSTTKRFAPDVMARYTPEYVSLEEWRRLESEHPLCRALLAAARLEEADTLEFPRLEFGKRDEAQLARDLTEAQKGAAKMTPPLAELVDTLKVGAGDSQPAPSPRWRVSFDLAYARALAAETRVKGYNDALAELKRGKTFENTGSTTWVLQPAQIPSSNSALKRAAETSRDLLQKIVADHAGTPWAEFAERELQVPIGWEWTER